MKTILIFLATILASFSITSCKVETKIEPVQKTDISEFLGQWTIDIQGGSVGWLEVRQEENYIDADLLWMVISIYSSPVLIMLFEPEMKTKLLSVHIL
jgi:hypothetical protein